MDDVELKKRLRRLKHVECRMRYRYLSRHPQTPLIWDNYFSAKSSPGKGRAIKYPFNTLRDFDHDACRRVFQEFMTAVFLQHAQEEGYSITAFTVTIHDPEFLIFLGLPPYATPDEIKKRFRELAHQYHPDKGGDPELMIKLLDIYEKIFPKKRGED